MDKPVTKYKLMAEQETPEQRAKRLEYCKEASRKYRLKVGSTVAMDRFYSKFTEEERLAYVGKKYRTYRANRKAKENAEQKEDRLKKERIRNNRYYAKKKVDPERYKLLQEKQKAYRDKRRDESNE
jgi:hypothetical protein